MLQKILILHFFAVQIHNFAHSIRKMNKQKYHFSGSQSDKIIISSEICREKADQNVSIRFILALKAWNPLKMIWTTFIADYNTRFNLHIPW